MVANLRESDTAPKEEWVNQDAGLDGRGGSSYINGVVLRNKDANTAWTSASDGTLEERIYLCQNWRGDVSVLTYSSGDQVEQVRYSPYGTPFGLPGGDTDSDGDCDATDVTQIQTWINAPAYDTRGDIDLDGDVDATDKSVAQASYQGLTLGLGNLSSFGCERGWSGYSKAVAADWYEARSRNISSLLGRWDERDPLGYVEGTSLYEYAEGQPLGLLDAFGTLATPTPTSGWIKGFKWGGRSLGKFHFGGGAEVSIVIICKSDCTCNFQGGPEATGGPFVGKCTVKNTSYTYGIPCPAATAEKLHCPGGVTGDMVCLVVECCFGVKGEVGPLGVGVQICSSTYQCITSCPE
jgi:RHS repeat-associated protein